MKPWYAGWAVGTVVVAIAAGLLLTATVLCRRIAAQAQDITRALDSARERTTPLFGLTQTNASLAEVTERLREVREKPAAP